MPTDFIRLTPDLKSLARVHQGQTASGPLAIALLDWTAPVLGRADWH